MILDGYNFFGVGEKSFFVVGTKSFCGGYKIFFEWVQNFFGGEYNTQYLRSDMLQTLCEGNITPLNSCQWGLCYRKAINSSDVCY